jgi:hypothetical protein
MFYYPYKSDKPEKKYFIITSSGKKVYFGQAGASDMTQHKDVQRKFRYIKRHFWKRKLGKIRNRYRWFLVSLVIMEQRNNKRKL